MKRTFIAALSLALGLMLASTAMAESWAVSYEGEDDYSGYAMLIADDGTPLTPPDTYSTLYRVTPAGTPEADARYAAVRYALPGDAPIRRDVNGFILHSAALMDGKGNLLTDFVYNNFDCAMPGEIAFMNEQELWGVMDADGRELLAPAYSGICSTGKGSWLAIKQEGKRWDYDAPKPIVFIDADGEHDTGLHGIAFYGTWAFSNGCCVMRNIQEYDGESVYFSDLGKPLFGRSFEEAEDFLGRFAVVYEDGKYGLINRSGKFAVPAIYDRISAEESAVGPIFLAVLGNALTVYSANTCETLLELRVDETEEIYCWQPNPWQIHMSFDEGERIYSLDGDLLYAAGPDEDITASFTLADEAPRACALTDGEWPNKTAHLLSPDGAIIDTGYRDLTAAAWQDGHGRFVAMDYRTFTDSDGDDAIYWRSWRYGLCDEAGNELLPCRFTSIEFLSMHRYWVKRGSRTGLIDDEGNWYYTIDDYNQLMD